jgi:hypothetical protein
MILSPHAGRTRLADGTSARGSDTASHPSGCLPKLAPSASPEEHGVTGHLQLFDDRVLVRRIEEPSSILLTDKPKSIKGVVLAVGPGKWIPGTWWALGENDFCEHGDPIDCGCTHYWIPGYRETPEVKPGQIVAFNSRWNDLSHAENKGTGADGKGKLERPLSYKLDKNVHLIREADIFGVLPSEHVRIEYLRTGMEELFVNKSTAAECFQSKCG